MKLRIYIAAILLLGALTVCSGLAYAADLKGSWNALSSGYAITRWPWDGGEIFVGDDATVRAGTTVPPPPEGSGPTQVVFRWIRPNGSSWDVGPVDLAPSGDTWDGKPIYDAYDTQTIDMLSTPTEDWGVQALFLDENGTLKGPSTPYPIVKIKAISWHAIPEVPFGTIAAALAFFGALAIYAVKTKKPNFSRVRIPK